MSTPTQQTTLTKTETTRTYKMADVLTALGLPTEEEISTCLPKLVPLGEGADVKETLCLIVTTVKWKRS
jgi:hypothetical protein